MSDSTTLQPLAERPKNMHPDRREVITEVSHAPAVEIQSGVTLRLLVGETNGARNLATGEVTFAPGVALAYHTHPCDESITLLQGRVAVEVEGRRYVLAPLDNVVVPAGLAHAVENLSTSETAVLHAAFPDAAPARDLVENNFTRQQMPGDSTGKPGAERVNRHALTSCYEPNPGANFKDFFNQSLGCEQMSGGYGIFEPGAQLPCHIHDFDESISIVQGMATCVVEGNRYTLSGNATALVPRGRCHYFINESDESMAMIWVYAGPVPERIIMEASLCNLRGEN